MPNTTNPAPLPSPYPSPVAEHWALQCAMLALQVYGHEVPGRNVVLAMVQGQLFEVVHHYQEGCLQVCSVGPNPGVVLQLHYELLPSVSPTAPPTLAEAPSVTGGCYQTYWEALIPHNWLPHSAYADFSAAANSW